ncbi:Circadian locomoter output cycles protein kaput [Eumeta japonica]|uniref:Circadian locomoter output cycles protein kaput n=1 Tax=Eumeta variegata TaxID=151549 RepID=A0A4C1WBQ5_EUMVA|nr:Circadian locomoter output cycles protein kaput [Eumeta japonica]
MSLNKVNSSSGECVPSVGQTSVLQLDFGMSVPLPSPSSPPLCYNMSLYDASPDLQNEMPVVRASDREARILAEKHRRNQYNALIKELMSLLPTVVNAQRKFDKTSVLRLAANKLRNEHVFGESMKCCHLETWSPRILSLLDIMGGVLIAMTCKGRIFNVSSNIQEKLGYFHIDLLGQDIYDYVHKDDHEILRQHICPLELHGSCDDKIFTYHHDFHIRIVRGGSKSDPLRYEKCHIDGTLRRADHATTNGVQDELTTIKRQRVRQNRTFSSSGNDFVFIGMIRVESRALPARVLPPTAHTEYWTRHLIDGRIVQCDQSISLVAGYMTDEVTGTSAFYFMHKDDVRWVICVLRQMYDQSKEFGESYYRLVSRSGHFIYMRTRGFLEIDKQTKQVQSFVCVNSVIDEDYGRKMVDEMKRKYSVIVEQDKQKVDSVLSIDDAPVEHPKRLERIVMHLVEPSVSESQEPIKIMPPSKDSIISAIKNSEKVISETGIRCDSRKRKLNELQYENTKNILKRHSAMQEKSLAH